MLIDDTKVASFSEFMENAEPRLRGALTAAWGPERGREATADAFAYGWEHWDRIQTMENPTGYLYKVGRDRARRMRPPVKPTTGAMLEQLPWVEPKLPQVLAQLPLKQRTVVALIHGYQWTFEETARLLGVSKGTVQTHEKRAMARLRKMLGVSS